MSSIKWFHDIDLLPNPNLLEHDSKVFLIGSCFTENISKKLSYVGVQNMSNPFGIVYNPYSILRQVRLIAGQNTWTKAYYEADGLVKNFLFHSELNQKTRNEYETQVSSKIGDAKQFIETANTICISYGTAWVYEDLEIGVVANCHKRSSKSFVKRFLGIEELRNINRELIELLKSINPQIDIVFTLSPIRHLKDGVIENSKSKAALLTAIHLCLGEDQVNYFPSYELMIDVLRDHRFYKSDLIHPSDEAIEFIWEKFKIYKFSQPASDKMKRVVLLRKRLSHKAFQEDTAEHQAFLTETKHALRNIKAEMPYLDLD